MVQTLEAIRGGGGSIKVGTTGKIGALMLRELKSVKPVIQTPMSHKKKSPTNSSSIVGSASSPKLSNSRALVDEAGSSGTSDSTKHTTPEIIRKSKHHQRSSNRIPMLESDNISVDGTPIRQKPDKRISYMVEVVDIKCGNPDRAWASPITNRLKKLSFSKLSESIG